MHTSHAQDVARPSPWFASAGLGTERIRSADPVWSSWQWMGASVGRRVAGVSLIGEVLRTRRFNVWDDAVAAEIYAPVWRAAYGYLRVQASPSARVIASTDAAGELYQGFGSGWEGSAGYRRLRFGPTTTNIVSTSLGRFQGDWFTRVAASTMTGRRNAASASLLLRRYWTVPAELAEVGVATGNEIASVGTGQQIDIRRGVSAHARVQRYFTPTVGGALVGTYASLRDVPSRIGGQARLLFRW
ncbi:MAG: YaiO family outer membrane beta-barrel protein [Gemmatimonadaceae bacterium]|nr:YaiO family outer membrane beta-barrel protein [Gemmatimonadaceae bacterium]